MFEIVLQVLEQELRSGDDWAGGGGAADGRADADAESDRRVVGDVSHHCHILSHVCHSDLGGLSQESVSQENPGQAIRATVAPLVSSLTSKGFHSKHKRYLPLYGILLSL
jgi:hypothetical protein